MSEKLEHNVWIAHALNYAPVSSILLVVKADTRIDNTVNSVRTYAERFGDLVDLITVCVTHMDVVRWEPEDFRPKLYDELGIVSVIFSGKSSGCRDLMNDILGQCKSRPHNLTINSENFLKFFKINDSKLKIMKHVNDEVNEFKDILRQFSEFLNSGLDDKDKVDVVFEFQTYMTQMITQAQKRVAELCGFSFTGANTVNEAGHLANLTNQLKAVLHEVRTIALGYTSSHGVSNLRRCPHCGLVWTKVSGCDGSTTCGNMDSGFDVRSANFASLATFHFEWASGKLTIRKSGTKRLRRPSSSRKGVGCGREVTWSEMAPVSLPPEFRTIAGVTTDDVHVLPTEAQPSWRASFAEAWSGKRVKVKKC